MSKSDIHIDDEEEYVDKRVKKRILESREQVDKTEQALFDEEILMPDVQIPDAQKVIAWGNTVRRFLRNIETVLLQEEIDQAEHYHKELELGSIRIVPPDKNGFEFSLVGEEGITDKQLKRQLNLPSGADIPYPKPVQFTGLVSVLESDPILSASWVVTLDDSGPPPTHEQITLQKQQPMPKSVYEDAIRASDRFLQQAGIGLNLKAQAHRSTEPGL